jgi:hypothetical protein
MLHDLKAPHYIPYKAEITELIYTLQGGMCHKCKDKLIGGSLHHALIHNNDWARDKWPGLVHHPVNLVLLCQDCHTLHGMYMQIQNETVIGLIEKFIVPFGVNNTKALKNIVYAEFKEFINWCDIKKTIAPIERSKA